MNRRLLTLLACPVLAGSLACGQPAEPPPDRGVVNPALGLRLAAVPDGFTVVRNQDDQLVLEPTAEDTSGAVTVNVGPVEDGVNLIAAMDAHQERIEGLPEGDYRGGLELQTPLGTAFYSRGRYRSDDGGLVEETRVLAIHPVEERLLTMEYRYPAGEDSKARVESLLELFSQVEAPVPAPSEP